MWLLLSWHAFIFCFQRLQINHARPPVILYCFILCIKLMTLTAFKEEGSMSIFRCHIYITKLLFNVYEFCFE